MNLNGLKRLFAACVACIGISVVAIAQQTDLVSMDIVNVSAYSFDLKVEKSDACQKYMAAVYHKEVFREGTFAESAEQTLDEDAYYRPFKETLCTESRVFAESQLNLNALASEDGKTEPQLVAAVYAIDEQGQGHVYTKEFSVPAAPTVESQATATVTIDEATLRFNHLDFTVTCSENTAKVIYAVTQPNYIESSLSASRWNGWTLAKQQEKLLAVFQGIPELYQGEINSSYSCAANSTCIAYAIPIDKDGKIGQVAVATINTGAVSMEGKGAFTGLSAIGMTEDDEMMFQISVDENAAAYRLMWFTATDEKNSEYIKRLPEVFSDEKYGDFGMWTEFASETAVALLNVYRLSEGYYLYGVTVDENGKLSQPVNLLAEYTGSNTIYPEYADLVVAPVSRNTSYGDFGTICVPYAAQCVGARLYTAEVSGACVVLTEVTHPEAGVPYIYQSTGWEQRFYNLGGDEVEEPVQGGVLTGAFTTTSVPAGCYVLQNQGNGQKFYLVEEGREPRLSPNKAYLSAARADGVKAFGIGTEETAIKAVEALANGKAQIFDLNGRRQQTLRRGVNIVNGVRVLVK